MTDLGEIYKEFLGGFQPKFSEIVSKYGKDRVFDNIELCGGAKITPNHRTVRMVAIPLDRERYEPGGDLVFLETSTSPKSNNFKYPGFEKGDIDSSVSWHPGDVPPEERSAYVSSISRRLNALDKLLSESDRARRHSRKFKK